MNSRPRTLIIINHAAARARRAWTLIESRLRASGVRFDAHETQHAGDATTRTRAALRAGYQLIGVVGGDGTLSEVATGFFALDEQSARSEQRGSQAEPKAALDEQKATIDEGRSLAITNLPAPVSADAALAILPAGTGDDFARGLTGKRESIELWLERLINYYEQPEPRATRAIDALHGRARTQAGALSFICLNVATLGLGAEVARRVAAQRSLMRRLPGEARFTAAACGALLAWRERRVRLTVDDSPALECSSNLLAVANGIYAGGGMMFAPGARPDDGLMDVLLACELTRAVILRELPRIRR
ncbi:MAG TPA: diacylglycerol kinase family protein, partial [Pyrinomonadaceae bacterium]